MLDLETMGTSSSSAIAAIGAVIFDYRNVYVEQKFYRVIDLRTSLGNIEADTVLWWLQQSDDVRTQLTRNQFKFIDTLLDFKLFVDAIRSRDKEKKVCMWGNGADFDNVILDNAYKRIEQQTPWRYSENRCYRTMKNIFSFIPVVAYSDAFVSHRADHDAINQAYHMTKILSYLHDITIEEP